jgi:replicative DNA helicase
VLEVNTPLLTTEGWTTVGEVKPTQRVFSYDGQAYELLVASPPELSTSTVQHAFSDGSLLVTSPDHHWTFETVNSRKALSRAKSPRVKPEVVSTAQLMEGPIRRQRKDTITEHMYSAPATDPLQFEARKYDLSPYLMGRAIGQSKGLFGRELPQEYMMGSIEQREDVLRGLYDSGRLTFWPSKGQFRVQTSNTRLLIQIQELVESLGHRTAMTVYRRRGDALIFKAQLPYCPQSMGPINMPRRHLVDVSRGASAMVRRLVVDGPKDLLAAGPTLIPTHG